MAKPPTIKQIAEHLGLSLMTVSRALRDGISVAPEIRERVRIMARSLGYQADARVSDVMSALRKSEVPQYREHLAFIWTPSFADQMAENSSFSEVLEGARRRAFLLGYQLEKFHLAASGLAGRKLSELLHSRGIRGVLIAPNPGRSGFRLGLDWSQFCCVLVGSSPGTEGVVCIEHDQYFGCIMAVRKLKRAGYQRLGLVTSRAMDRLTFRLIQSAFISFHPLGPEEAKKLIFISDRYRPKQLDQWLKQAKPQALLAQFEDTFPRKEQLLAHAPPGMGLATLNWTAADPEVAGVNQHHAKIGEMAVNLLLERLQQGTRFGLDPMATSIKIPGAWVAANRVIP
jgi:LacI family transcriptional regulator